MTSNTIYDVQFFIDKFSAIPTNKIGRTQSSGCAYGQCSTNGQDGAKTKMGKQLERLMMSIPGLTPSTTAFYPPYDSTPARISNGEVEQYQQPTAKQRILAALYDIAAMQSKKVEGEKIEPTFDPIIDKPVYPDFSPVTYEKIKELIPQHSNS